MTPAAVREARRKLGLRQSDLAAVMGLGRWQTISEWETQRPPEGPALRLLQAYLAGYRPDDWPGKETP